MRSPLTYPLNRTADTDVGGASDLQTDVMRFMAILSLCLVAIFALVQSMPMAPAPVEPPTTEVDELTPFEPQPMVVKEIDLTRPAPAKPQPAPKETVSLTRPRSTPAPRPEPLEVTQPPADVVATEPDEEANGFTLRFESDLALTRLVASNQVGLYAFENNRARRMSISESRISFWDASTPGAFHEMERATVPQPVIDALARTGADPDLANWGVTLPGRLRTQLDSLMREHHGGQLVIGPAGTIRREPAP